MPIFCRGIATYCKVYASPLASHIMGLTEQLTLISHGTKPISEYLAQVHDLANELALIGSPIPQQYLITHILNGVRAAFKELATAVYACDTFITFDELHDKLVEYESFFKQEEQRSNGILGPITMNTSQFSQASSMGSSKKNNNSHKGYSKNNNNSLRRGHDSFSHTSASTKPVVFCYFYEKKGHIARQCYIAKHLLLLLRLIQPLLFQLNHGS